MASRILPRRLINVKRGIRSFLWLYGSEEDYYDHTEMPTIYKPGENVGSYDFRDQHDVDRSVLGTYSTSFFAHRAVKIISVCEYATR